MALNAGNSDCTSGLAKRFYDAWAAVVGSEYIAAMAPSRLDGVKASFFAKASNIADEIAADGIIVPRGTYDAQIAYAIGDTVIDSSSDGYQSLVSNNAGNEPSTSPTYWAQVSVAGSGGGGVPTSRHVDSGDGLQGGGDLTTNRTLSIKLDGGTLTAGANGIKASVGSTVGTVCAGDDARLSDARTPTAHNQTISTISDSTTVGQDVVKAATQADARNAIGAGTSSLVLGSTGGTACEGNDSRLSNARAPTAHASTHKTAQSDALAPSDIGAAASSHTHPASDISDSGTTGRAVVQAATQAAAQSAVGTDAAGVARPPTAHGHPVSDLSDSGTTGRSIVQAATQAAAQSAVGTDATGSARPPTAHMTSHKTGGSDALAPGDIGAAASSHTHTVSQISDSTTVGQNVVKATDQAAARTAIGAGTSSLVIGTTTGTACEGNDSRVTGAVQTSRKVQASASGGLQGGGDLTADRTDLAVKLDGTTLTVGVSGIKASVGTASGTVCAGDDARLADARAPTAHAASHKGGGSDVIATVTSGATGLCPQLSGTAGQYLDGTGAWIAKTLATLSAPVSTSGTGETLLLKASVAANTVAVGTTFRVSLAGVSSSTGTLIFRVRIGANGSTGDNQSWISTTSAAQAANQWAGMDVVVAIRSIGSGGTSQGAGCAWAGTARLPQLLGAAATAAVNTTATFYLDLDVTCSSGTFTAHVGTIERV